VNGQNGREKVAERIELADRIVLETRGAGAGPDEALQLYEFEVVAIVSDPSSEPSRQFAVCYSERADEFIVTDDVGRLIEDDRLAQDILADFLEQSAGGEGDDPETRP